MAFQNEESTILIYLLPIINGNALFYISNTLQHFTNLVNVDNMFVKNDIVLTLINQEICCFYGTGFILLSCMDRLKGLIM